MRLPATVFGALLLIAFPAVVLLMAAAATPRPGQPPATLVIGGALAVGIGLRSTYKVLRALRRQRKPSTTSDHDISERPNASAGWGAAFAVTGLALMAKALVPTVFGLDIGLVGPVFGAGLFLPFMPSLVMRAIREEGAVPEPD